jgi:mycothiol synthase
MVELSVRLYQGEEDYRRICGFLREVFLLNERRMLSWPVARLNYWRWHGIYNLGQGALEKNVFLWETQDGQIACVLNCEGLGNAFLQVNPAFNTPELEKQMIIMAEKHLWAADKRGGDVLRVWTDAGDASRIEVLRQRGYVHLAEKDEHQWRRSLELRVHEAPLFEGYTVRSLGDSSELPSRSWASWRAFHSNKPDENYGGDWHWYVNIQAAPLYRPDLDLVAIAPQGGVAAFTTIWYDEITQCGYFEPVGSMPEHQRRGLARALLCEGMQRLQRLGATQCMVVGGSQPANALYEAVLGPVYDLYQPWEKRWAE